MKGILLQSCRENYGGSRRRLPFDSVCLRTCLVLVKCAAIAMTTNKCKDKQFALAR